MRVLRSPSGEILKQTREFTSTEGKPVGPDQGLERPVFPLTDGLVYAQDMFFTAQSRPCFVFVLVQPGRNGALELRITSRPDAGGRPGCRPGLEELTGVVRVDPATNQLIHAERTLPAAAALPHHRAPFASTDFGPIKVGDKTFWLPTDTVSIGLVDGSNGSVKTRTPVHYSDYHQYTATVTVLPGTVGEEPAQP